MPSYYANVELQGWQSQQSNYAQAQQVYADNVAAIDAQNAQAHTDWQAAHAAWQTAHDAWVADPGDPPQPEPIEPVEPTPTPYPPEPTAPDAAQLTIYSARDVIAPEQLDTPSGPALIVPPRVVLSANGASFALSQQDLDRNYTPVSEGTP